MKYYKTPDGRTVATIGAIDAQEITKEEFDRIKSQAETAIETESAAIANIAELKKQLLDTDYKALKYAEGAISDADYADIKAQRQAWRDEINRIEAEVESMRESGGEICG